MTKILIVEDEEAVVRGLEINLKREGFEVLATGRGERALPLVLKEAPHLIVLDIMLPGMNGFDVCREIRLKGIRTPIIMLTAKSEEIDRVVGLELGADDYVTKPFSVRELVARIRARLRNPSPPNEDLAGYRFGDIEIDFKKYEATRRGEPIELTPKEYEILRFLIRHRGEVVTRDQLLDQVWGYDNYPTTHTVDNHILKLRQKVERDPARPRYILSIYGEGYKFVA